MSPNEPKCTKMERFVTRARARACMIMKADNLRI